MKAFILLPLSIFVMAFAQAATSDLMSPTCNARIVNPTLGTTSVLEIPLVAKQDVGLVGTLTNNQSNVKFDAVVRDWQSKDVSVELFMSKLDQSQKATKQLGTARLALKREMVENMNGELLLSTDAVDNAYNLTIYCKISKK